MSSHLNDLLATNARLCAACQLERDRLRVAYAMPTCEPYEQPSPAFVAARDRAERRLGVKLWKYFMSKEMIG